MDLSLRVLLIRLRQSPRVYLYQRSETSATERRVPMLRPRGLPPERHVGCNARTPTCQYIV
jgi:hypothetical protein